MSAPRVVSVAAASAAQRAGLVVGDELLAIDGRGNDGPSGPKTGNAPSLEDYFRRFVREHEGRLSETEMARQLGLSRKALWERRQRMGIPRRSAR